MNIRPIRTNQDYEQALQQIEALFDAQPNTPEGDMLDILTTLVEVYETQTHPIAAPDPIEAITYYLESRGMTRRDIEPYIGNRARVSEIINKRRPLTLEMIRKLHDGLGIPAEILIRPYSML
jgi:HTH-type transcriptional regulator/antitoxin HigA